MSKSSRRRGPVEQYEQFMSGNKTPGTTRGVLLLAGGIVGNTVAWLLGLMTIARIGTLLAFVVVTAVALGILQRAAPTLELSALLLGSAIIGLIVVIIGAVVLKLVLRRDSQRLNQQAVFGVGDEDARVRDRQKYRRKAGR